MGSLQLHLKVPAEVLEPWLAAERRAAVCTPHRAETRRCQNQLRLVQKMCGTVCPIDMLCFCAFKDLNPRMLLEEKGTPINVVC